MKVGKELIIDEKSIFQDLNRNERKTKIVATVGESCASQGSLVEMIDAGVNIFRFDMSRYDTKVRF